MLEQIVRNPSLLQGAIEVRDGRVVVADESKLASPLMDELVRAAVFGDDETKELARWVIWEAGQQVGVRAASIHDLYVARGRAVVRSIAMSGRLGARRRKLARPRRRRNPAAAGAVGQSCQRRSGWGNISHSARAASASDRPSMA